MTLDERKIVFQGNMFNVKTVTVAEIGVKSEELKEYLCMSSLGGEFDLKIVELYVIYYL